MSVISKIHRTGNHKAKVFRVEKYDGEHKDINICQQGCIHFKPDELGNNCSIAQTTFELSKIVGIILVHSCRSYETK